MKKDRKDVGRVPNKGRVHLRFPEFEGEWEVKKLGEVANKVKKKNTDDIISIVFSNSAIHGIVLQNEYFDKEIANRDNLNGYYVVSPNDFVYNPRLSSNAEVGAMSINKTELVGLVSPLYTVFGINNQNIDVPFIQYIFKSKVWHNYMKSVANYGARDDRMNIKDDDLFALPLFIPQKPEQEKIASFLSLIDERISTQIKIIEALKELKASLSKQIFSRKLRFKDENGNDFPEWVEKRLGDISTIQSGLSKDQNSVGSGYMVTRIETISNGCVDLDRVGYVNTIDDIKAYKLNIGNILFSNINSVSHIGKTAIINSSMNLYHGMNLLCLKVNNLVNANFLFFVLNSEQLRNHFRTICNQAVSQASINQTELSKTNISLPVLQEQKMIVDFFTNIDGKIEVETKTYELLIKQKQYLLQQMFI